MANQQRLDKVFMDIAVRLSQESHALRRAVGAVLVKNLNIISFGWNGTPSGDDNNCEDELPDGTLVTKPSVLHAELNALGKLTESGGIGAAGSTLYVTLSPCNECAKIIHRCGVVRVVYKDEYRVTNGIDFLRARKILVEQLNDSDLF